jgi:hypothetical protein
MKNYFSPCPMKNQFLNAISYEKLLYYVVSYEKPFYNINCVNSLLYVTKIFFMKTALLRQLLVVTLVFMAGTLIAQPPPALPMQNVAKDPQGNPAKNRKVYVKIEIRHARINGTVVWAEAFETTTDGDGIYTIVVGMGNKTSSVPSNMANIGEIDWGNGPYFFNQKLAVSPSVPAAWWLPATNYIDLGTIQMMSVSYAMFAGNASVTNVTQSLPPGSKNTFLVTDSAGNVTWAPPQAANVNVTNVTNLNLNLAIQSGQNIEIEPNTTSTVEIQVGGVQVGDPILVTPQGDYPDWTIYSSWVARDGIVKIRFANFTDTKVDVKGSHYKIVVIK